MGSQKIEGLRQFLVKGPTSPRRVDSSDDGMDHALTDMKSIDSYENGDYRSSHKGMDIRVEHTIDVERPRESRDEDMDAVSTA